MERYLSEYGGRNERYSQADRSIGSGASKKLLAAGVHQHQPPHFQQAQAPGTDGRPASTTASTALEQLRGRGGDRIYKETAGRTAATPIDEFPAPVPLHASVGLGESSTPRRGRDSVLEELTHSPPLDNSGTAGTRMDTTTAVGNVDVAAGGYRDSSRVRTPTWDEVLSKYGSHAQAISGGGRDNTASQRQYQSAGQNALSTQSSRSGSEWIGTGEPEYEPFPRRPSLSQPHHHHLGAQHNAPTTTVGPSLSQQPHQRDSGGNPADLSPRGRYLVGSAPPPQRRTIGEEALGAHRPPEVSLIGNREMTSSDGASKIGGGGSSSTGMVPSSSTSEMLMRTQQLLKPSRLPPQPTKHAGGRGVSEKDQRLVKQSLVDEVIEIPVSPPSNAAHRTPLTPPPTAASTLESTCTIDGAELAGGAKSGTTVSASLPPAKSPWRTIRATAVLVKDVATETTAESDPNTNGAHCCPHCGLALATTGTRGAAKELVSELAADWEQGDRELDWKAKEDKLRVWATQLRDWSMQLEARESAWLQEVAAQREDYSKKVDTLGAKEVRTLLLPDRRTNAQGKAQDEDGLPADQQSSAVYPAGSKPSNTEGSRGFSWSERWSAAMAREQKEHSGGTQ